jgi:hypothetical protein
MTNESKFPTIIDLQDCLSRLIERGFGELAFQIVVAPDSTMQALAQAEGDAGKPALMIEYPSDGSRLGVCFISTERLSGGGGMPSRSKQ